MNIDQRLYLDEAIPLEYSDRILFVDDEQNVLTGYRRLLRGRYAIETSASPEEALQMIERNGPYAVIVADMMMPNMDGAELLARCKALAPDTVRVMVTGNVDQHTAVEAVNRGEVFRFLNKPCERELLTEALDNALRFHRRSVEERARLNRSLADVDKLTDQLSNESKRDLLTGLYNRHAFETGLRDSLEESLADSSTAKALCHLDFDHFHVINETSGHMAGDALLRAVGELLTSKCDVNDLIGRVAGDDFAILFHDADLERARLIVDDLCQTLHHFNFEWEGRLLDTRVSIGLVPIDATIHSATQLMSAAENACHVALDRGGGQVHVASVTDNTVTERVNQAQWVSRIHHALRNDRFRLFAQRIMPIAGVGEGDHYELLIRMLDEHGEIVPPGRFLNTAEQYHLSILIDRWVISKAEECLSSHPGCLEKLSFCSINLSGHSIGHPEILAHIRKTFSNSCVPSQKICFEITETAAIARVNTAIQFVKQLKQQGFRFALDDFGSGLSSFAYLKSLPVDYLKIDGFFVKEIDVDEIDRAMVRSINEVAKLMGKQTIAEYVENEGVLDVLRGIGVDYAQGYHIGKPMPLEEIA